jgi:uncharacterized protein YndB with AHSA1/START domain
MASTVVTPDHDTIVSEIDIAAPVERVFKAIADAGEIRRRTPSLSVYEMDARVGGSGGFRCVRLSPTRESL